MDCIFSNAVINGVYSFHASPNAYTQYWNNSFGLLDSFHRTKLNRKHIWQSFIQESIRTIAETSKMKFEADSNMFIDNLIEHAFTILGSQGITQPAQEHSCSECTKPYKETVNSVGDSNCSVNMVVLNGIVMGPQHCAYKDCTNSLLNARGGSFCGLHEVEYGDKCQIVGCTNSKIAKTQACDIREHMAAWKQSVEQRSQISLAGV